MSINVTAVTGCLPPRLHRLTLVLRRCIVLRSCANLCAFSGAVNDTRAVGMATRWRSRLVAVGLAVVVLFVAIPPSRASAEPEVRRLGESVALNVAYVDAAGARIAYAELGAGPPLVLLNGTGSTMSEWDPVLLAELSASNRVIVFDYPGLGQSGRPPAKITFDRLANWTAAFMRAINVDPVNIMGWSMGGFVAQRLTVRHRNLVNRLVLAGTNPGSRCTVLGPKWVQEADSDPDGSNRSYLRTNYPHDRRAQDAGRRFLQRVAEAVVSGRYPPIRVPTRTYDAMVRAEDPWLRSSRNLRDLAAVQQPTLVIDGTDDWVTPPANSRLIASRIPGAQLRIFRGTGHSFLFQKPRLVAAEINRFLNRQR